MKRQHKSLLCIALLLAAIWLYSKWREGTLSIPGMPSPAQQNPQGAGSTQGGGQ